VKAVILLAGMGSRLGALTETTPKSLLPIGDSTTLDRMVTSLGRHGFSSVVVVCGHLQADIEAHLAHAAAAPAEITVLRNAEYATTNTAASLLVAREHLAGESFVKLDGDVVFDDDVMARLVAAPGGASYVCVDRTAVDDEVVKVQCSSDGAVVRIGNRVPVGAAAGESIGLERIDAASSGPLFDELEAISADPAHRQSYYEVAYDALVRAGEPFRALDVTGLPWVEIDTLADYELAQRLFVS
jgi:choline kinase